MKYTILINQAGIVEAGLGAKTDLIDWAILDYIQSWQCTSGADKKGEMVWINYQHLIDEMPLLGLNTKGAISNRIKKLQSLGLVDADYDLDDRKVYARTSQLYFDVVEFKTQQGVHSHERGVHSHERGVHSHERGVHSHERGVHSHERGVHSHELDTTISIQPSVYNHQDKTISEQGKETTSVVSKKKEKIQTKNGTRFDLESLPNPWRDFCQFEKPELHPDRVYERFRDYWIAQPGVKGRKLDWFATWRNWVRNENLRAGHDQQTRPAPQYLPPDQRQNSPIDGRVIDSTAERL